MQDLTYQPSPKVAPRDILARGLRAQCPNCGQAKLFRNLLHIHHRCPSCGMTLERGDGYYLGPLCLNYGLVAFGIVSPLMLAGFADWMPLKLAITLALLAAFLLPLFIYRWCWSLWLTIYYICLPHELHANRDENSDDLSFEEEPRTRP